MKIVLLTNNQNNQKALASRIAAQFNLSGIVIENRHSIKKRSAAIYINALLDRMFLSDLRNAWTQMQAYYGSKFAFPGVEKIEVSSINSQATIEFINKINPDLLIVSGTSIIREPLISIKLPLGIINLHTGLSPYVKGGPNCTNWCLADKKFHLIGNTVMWIDSGIDSGEVISTELTEFTGDESLPEMHRKVMEHAHQLTLKVTKLLEEKGKVKGISQNEIGHGAVYYSKQWNLKKKMQAIKNFPDWKIYIKQGKQKDDRRTIRLVNPFT